MRLPFLDHALCSMLLTFPLLASCVHAPGFPGPLGSLGRDLPPPAVFPLPADTDDRAPAEDPLPRGTENAAALVKAAEYFLDHKPVGFTDDCTGFVCASFDRTGVELHGNVPTLWAAATAADAVHHRRIPNVGDIVFFDGTIDRDRDGRQDDPLTHVALVLAVDGKTGDLLLAHGGYSGGRALFHMNLLHPHDRTNEAGEVINDSMRKPKPDDPAGVRYLGSELWAGFATFHAEDASIWASATATKVSEL